MRCCKVVATDPRTSSSTGDRAVPIAADCGGGWARHARAPSDLNVWQDPAASAFVRSVNEGNEVVPTVVIAGRAQTNPDPDAVLRALPG